MAFPNPKDIEIPLLKVLIAAGGHATPKEALEAGDEGFSGPDARRSHHEAAFWQRAKVAEHGGMGTEYVM